MVNCKECQRAGFFPPLVFLYTSVRLMITSCARRHGAAFLTEGQITEMHIKKQLPCLNTKYHHRVTMPSLILPFLLWSIMYPICSDGAEWPLLTSIWSSVDCLRNEIAQVAADGGGGGGVSNTDTMSKEWKRERHPNVKIAILYKRLCNIHANATLERREMGNRMK